MLRRAVYFDHYYRASTQGKSLEKLHGHLDHCVEMLRQSLMCSMDLTPVPLVKWYSGEETIENIHVTNVIQGQSWTCREFEPIREWLSSRNGRDEAS